MIMCVCVRSVNLITHVNGYDITLIIIYRLANSIVDVPIQLGYCMHTGQGHQLTIRRKRKVKHTHADNKRTRVGCNVLITIIIIRHTSVQLKEIKKRNISTLYAARL